MREMSKLYETILVVSGEGEKGRKVSEGYGFQDLLTPGNIIKDHAHKPPFRQLTAEVRSSR
jgi:hypothetical protein